MAGFCCGSKGDSPWCGVSVRDWAMADEDETADTLRAEIHHLRRLVDSITDTQMRDEMQKMIEELEQRLREIGARSALSVPHRTSRLRRSPPRRWVARTLDVAIRA
jgi:hypothetical protein